MSHTPIPAPTAASNDSDLVLEVTRMTRRASGGGTWVSGRVADYRFEALVFPAHAESEEYELGRSRVSKLWVQRLADQQTVFNFDRGLDIGAADATTERLVAYLCAKVADRVYPAGQDGARVR